MNACALILAGGSGTRFWPLSRRARPKQLLSLMGDRSLLQATLQRLDPTITAQRVYYSTTQALAQQVTAELRSLSDQDTDGGLGDRVLAEPMGRNTAPAMAWCVDAIRRHRSAVGEDDDPVIAVLSSDHYVTDPAAFRAALQCAIEEAAERRRVVTLGVPPRWAETGYGYLQLDQQVDALAPYEVVRFTEKPDEANAQAFLQGGRHLWNAGNFVFRASMFEERMRQHQPEIMTLVEEMRGVDGDEAASLYSQMPDVSIDFGLMEHLDDTAAVPLECGWNDLGSWDALAQVIEADADGNRLRGDVFAIDSSDNLVVADEGTVAVIGASNLVVVRTGDSVLVMPRGKAQEVRKIVAALRSAERADRL